MCRLLGYISNAPITLNAAVGEDFERFVDLSSKHSDGWGLAQLVRQPDGLQVYRLPESARQSSVLGELARTQQSDAGILHLRWATPGLPIQTANTHPFHRGEYAFMHNGAISNEIDSLVVPELRPLLEGNTDSEKYFLVALAHVNVLGPLSGMIRAVEQIGGSCDYTSLNAMLLTPDELIVVSEHRLEGIPADEPRDYYELRYQISHERLVVASTGWPQAGWKSLPNHSVSRMDVKSLTVSTHSLARD
jgi:predicted glutamine amidotransferase